MASIAELLEGKNISTVRMEGTSLFLHLDNDSAVVILCPFMHEGVPMIGIAAEAFEGATLQ